MWWKKNKWRIIVPVALIVILAAAFWYGGNAPGSKGWSPSSNAVQEREEEDAVQTSGDLETGPADAAQTNASNEIPETPDTSESVLETSDMKPDNMEATDSETENTGPSEQPGGEPREEASEPPESSGQPTMEIDPETGKDQYQTDPVPAGKPLPVEPQDVTIGTAAHTCTISISCATILDNMDYCDPDKVELVPEDGWILEATQVTFYEGESVFNVLQRTCKQMKIHMEYSDTPMYNSAYIEGINNLYEFDVGDLSGWMYKVNGWFPNYGCSRYQLQDGDVIEWVYTCDLGHDVGGESVAQN